MVPASFPALTGLVATLVPHAAPLPWYVTVI